MDAIENKYEELLENYKKLEQDLKSLRLRSGIKTDTDRNPEKQTKNSNRNLLVEIFETVSSYLALFRVSDDNRILVAELNRKAEETEGVVRSELVGKYIEDTPLAHQFRLMELLDLVRQKGAHKLSASSSGDDSEGYYMGFILTSGNILVTWEPGQEQKSLEDITRQDIFFEKFADMLPEMIYEVDLKGKVIYANKRGLDFFGYTREDLDRGTYISELFPDSYRKMIGNLKNLHSPEDASSNRYTAKKKDGTEVPIETHSFATFHNDNVTGYRGILKDLSAQKKYEDDLTREKAFLENLIDSTPEAIAITDFQGRITMINNEFTNLFGYTKEETRNKKIDELIVPEELISESDDIELLTTRRQKVVRHTERKDKNGNRIYVSLIATNIIINDEIVANIGIYRDISLERKNQIVQEILYNISSSALNQFDIKDIYPTIVNELGKIWDTSNFFIALYDKRSDTLSLPFFADEKDNFEKVSAKKTITGWVIKLNRPVLLKENDLKAMEDSGDIDLVGTPCKIWMGVPLKVDNQTIGVMCLQDYNDENKFSQDDVNVLAFIAGQVAIAIQRRTMLDNLVQARQNAEEAVISKQQFMSTMSHEIRTPLNEVIGITNLLLQGNPREDQMDFIKTLRFSGNHLLSLVNDVLDYNKMESGKIIFEQTQFNLIDFLNDIMRSYSYRSKEKNLEFEIKKPDDLPTQVIGDQVRLNQILSNLLSNALKFTKQGSIHVIINELKKSETSVVLEFSVRDTGIGIPREKHKMVFESFTQASPDTTRHFGGTGLGLAICKKLVELQGGVISLDSEPGKGSDFKFSLSFGISAGSNKVQDGEASDSYAGLEGKRILVAEDNKINFFVANKFLIGWGIKVTHAENGKIALELLEKEDFDLVLMDLHMPVLDGIEATRIIRKSENPRIRNIPVVALTAAIMSESHDKIEDIFINDYILKPFKPRDLFDKIRKHVN